MQAAAEAAPSAPVEPKKKVLGGAAASGAGKMAEQVLRFIGTVVLSHALYPEAFGVMGLVITILMGIEMLSDLGVRVSVITNRREDPGFLDTAFTINFVRGLVLFVVAAILAWPFSYIYRAPELRLMVPVAALSAIFAGATSTKLYVANRHMQVWRMNVVQLGAQVVQLAVTIGLALTLRSTWALVFGALVNAAVVCLLSHVALPGRTNRLRWEREAARDILQVGSWVFISTTLTFFAMKIDILLLGRLVDKAQLGVYNQAASLAALPAIVGGQIIGHVLLPALATAFRENVASLVSTYQKARRQLLPLGGYICLGVALGSPPLFLYVFDQRYHDAAWMTPLMMLSAWLVFLQEASSRALAATGNLRPMAFANAAKLLFLVIGCLVGRWLAGTPGFILGSAVGALAGHLVIMISLKRAGLPAGKIDVIYTFVAVAVGAAGLYLPYWLERVTGIGRKPLSLVVAVAILVPTGLLIARRLMRDSRTPAS